jgi:predicted transcriptional regulator
MALPKTRLSERCIKLLRLSEVELKILNILFENKMAKPISMIIPASTLSRTTVHDGLATLVERDLVSKQNWGIYGKRFAYMINKNMIARLRSITPC